MTRSTDLKREVDRWKDKYFEQNEVFEEEKAFAKEYEGLLKRLLVRVSLAAEHVSEELDAELNRLRAAVREATPQKNDLAKRLRRIDDLILATDEGRQQNAGLVVDAMQRLVEQLLSLKVPRKQKRELRKLEKSLEKRVQSFQEYPGILSEYAVLQAETLKDIVGDTKPEAGFISRFLGGGKASSNEDKQSLQSEESESDGDSPVAIEITADEADLEVMEAAPEGGDEFVPGFASIAGHVSATLNGLLDQLVFPHSAGREVERLRERVSGKLNWYELGPTLDDLSNLVLSVVGRGQRDFERFLVQLDQRLSRVQGYLLHTEQAEEEWRDKNIKFDLAMRERVSEMSQDLVQVVEIEELKQSITSHIDLIANTMDSFQAEGDAYQQDKDAELSALKERIQEMEQETADIRERLKEERSKALRDKLTDLPNREAYDERMELELERWKRYGHPSTLVVADIDHFKSINDTYGHLSGDKVLQIISKELQNRTRKTDFVARYGGEEFVIILPETNVDQAAGVIEKTREMIARLPFHFKEKRVQITMSFGMVAFSECLDVAGLFEQADKALYQAKEQGRNRVIVNES